MNLAYKRVYQNGGKSGVDKMEVTHMLPYLRHHKEELINTLTTGRYRPNPVRRVLIPKESGKTRPLGIPTVIDRLIQQSIFQIVSPLYEREFSDNSYGFRPKRSAHQALRKAQSYITKGYKYAVDLDLAQFFDTVNQSRLIEILSRKIKDGRVISLIHKYLRAGVMNGNIFEESRQGVPQGSPLSPLLSNIMLNEMDKELHQRGHNFVRYADDCMIFCKSKRAAERVCTHIIRYIEQNLLLKVNRDKTKVGYVGGMRFLGYSFYVIKGECRLCVHPKSYKKLRLKLKELTGRSNGMGYERRKQTLTLFIRGWVEYFKIADMKSRLSEIDEWLRRRLRMCIWKSWKRIKTRFKNLLRCGLKRDIAYMCANNSKGYWYISGTSNLNQAITNEKLRRAGYPNMLDYYRKIAS
jgi:group II intron reverse transcriptase/maturase